MKTNEIDYTECDKEKEELKETFTAPKSGLYELRHTLGSKEIEVRYLGKDEELSNENE